MSNEATRATTATTPGEPQAAAGLAQPHAAARAAPAHTSASSDPATPAEPANQAPATSLSALVGPMLAGALYAVLCLPTAPYRDAALRPGASSGHDEMTDAAASAARKLEEIA